MGDSGAFWAYQLNDTKKIGTTIIQRQSQLNRFKIIAQLPIICGKNEDIRSIKIKQVIAPINKNIPIILAKKGTRLYLGGGAVMDILFPDRNVSAWASNDGSVVAKLSYGKTSIMLTGDTTTETEKMILEENSKDKLQSTILKVGHHGSRTSTSYEFIKTTGLSALQRYIR